MQMLALSTEMTLKNARGLTGAETWLLSVPPTRRQTRWAIAIAGCQVAALALVAPFARTQLAEINAFIPAFGGVTFVTGLVTSALLFSQFAVCRLRALLVLACGYLFSALMVIPYTLTFPGAFSPAGLLGAGLQTTASLYWFWHLLFPMALLGYGLMRDEKSGPGQAEPSSLAVIVESVALVVTLVCGLTLLATAGNNYLPVLFTDRVDFTPVARAAGASTMLVSASAVAVLWLGRRSLFDQWLMIVALAAILEMALGSIFVSGRFSLGFYAGRVFSLLTSTIILVVLLAETARLYATIARSNERKIRRLVDANILGICISNLEGAIIEANEAFLRMLQYGREDVASRRLRWTDLTPAGWREQDERSVAELRSTGAFHPVEKEYFRKDGSRVPVLVGGALFEKGGDEGVIFALDLTEHKRAVEALRESERKLRQFFESVPCQFWSADPDGEPTYVNQRLLDYFGMQVGDLKFDDWQAVLHPDDVPETEMALYRAFRTGEPFQRVPRLRRADGVYRWHRTHAECLRDHKGDIIQWYGFNVDIDEGKKAEDALRRNEDRLRRSEAYLAESQKMSHTCSAAFNEAGMLYFSEEASRMFGFDPLQGIPSREAVWQRIHPDDLDRVNENIERAVREKRNLTNEFRLVLPDGMVKHVESSCNPVFSASGELVEIIGTGVDVTERKRAEDALRRSRAYLAEAQRLSVTGSFGWRVSSNTAFWSKETYRIFDADPAVEPSVELVLERTHPDDRELVSRLIERVSKEDRDFDYEHRLLLPDGTIKHLHVRTHRGRFEGGEVEVFGAVMDITAARKAEEALRRAQAELAHASRVATLGELSASIVHEVNQPITSIVASGQAAIRWLERDVPEKERAHQAIMRLLNEAQRASQVIFRIRELAKKTEPVMAQVDVNRLIEDVLVLISGEAAGQRVEVRPQLASELPPALGDRVQLQQVLINLVINGIQAMASVTDRARVLVIRTECYGDDELFVAVEDAGVGIAPENLTQLFSAFYTTKPDGMGMGLSISRSIVEAHGGRLWATCNSGPGMTFQFTLSVHHEHAAG
jgi:PAS domain S-box-containing protein